MHSLLGPNAQCGAVLGTEHARAPRRRGACHEGHQAKRKARGNTSEMIDLVLAYLYTTCLHIMYSVYNS